MKWFIGCLLMALPLHLMAQDVPPAFQKESAESEAEKDSPEMIAYDPFDPSVYAPKMVRVQVEFIEMAHKDLTRLMMEENSGTADATALRMKVLAFRPVDGPHALEVSCKEADDKVIFYRPPAAQDFATACKWLRKWRKDYVVNAELPGTWGDRLLHVNDEVRVPYVSLDVTTDLSGRLQGGRFYGNAGDP
jgi:hypothetical protein